MLSAIALCACQVEPRARERPPAAATQAAPSVAPAASAAKPPAAASAPTPAPAPAPNPSLAGPHFIPGAVPVAPFLAEQLLDEPSGGRTVVYAGASWCEPCQRFHRAVEAGELDAALPGVRFVEYDYDVAKQALAADGYSARLIPLFARPGPDGRASGRGIAGSIKGEGAVQSLVPRLQAMLAER